MFIPSSDWYPSVLRSYASLARHHATTIRSLRGSRSQAGRQAFARRWSVCSVSLTASCCATDFPHTFSEKGIPADGSPNPPRPAATEHQYGGETGSGGAVHEGQQCVRGPQRHGEEAGAYLGSIYTSPPLTLRPSSSFMIGPAFGRPRKSSL